MDYSPPASSVHGLRQARILERVAMPSSRGSSQARDRTRVSYLFCIGRWALCHLLHLGSPQAAGILTTVKINSTVVPAAIEVCLVHVPGFSLFFVLFCLGMCLFLFILGRIYLTKGLNSLPQNIFR